MPNYNWLCHICEHVNNSGTDTCPVCGNPASLNAIEIQQRKEEFARGLRREDAAKPTTGYLPNEIPVEKRLRNIFLSIALMAYGIHGIYVNDLWIPRRRGRDIHLTDEAIFVMNAAFVCGCLVLISAVVDHYDQRNNEHKYKAFATVLKVIALILFFVAVFMQLVKELGM